MKDKDKLKLSAVLQNLATLGASWGTAVPILSKWGEGQQQLTANYARALEQKIAQEKAKKNKRSGLLGALGGLLGVATGGLASPLVGAIAGVAGSSIGQLAGGGEFNPITPIQYGIQGYTTGSIAKQYALDRVSQTNTANTLNQTADRLTGKEYSLLPQKPKVTFGDMVRAVSISSGFPVMSTMPTNYYVVKVNGQPMVVDPSTLSVIQPINLEEEEKKK